ncbi:hypothetical protein IAI18_15150 [Acetobacteraceae bacterium H6797]|nr:hypothetical protein [Acetobacteraceae bacterium H6797]
MVGALGLVAVTKVDALWRGTGFAEALLVPNAMASAPEQKPAQPRAPEPPPAPATADAPDPAKEAEKAILESLRARRQTLDTRETALAAREQVLQAAEKRLTDRLREMEELQRKLVAESDARNAQDEAGWRGLVKVYESMKPRDAASIFDDLDMPVLVQIVTRMKEAKASPVIGAMRPDRARELTTELARQRAGRSG